MKWRQIIDLKRTSGEQIHMGYDVICGDYVIGFDLSIMMGDVRPIYEANIRLNLRLLFVNIREAISGFVFIKKIKF